MVTAAHASRAWSSPKDKLARICDAIAEQVEAEGADPSAVFGHLYWALKPETLKHRADMEVSPYDLGLALMRLAEAANPTADQLRAANVFPGREQYVVVAGNTILAGCERRATAEGFRDAVAYRLAKRGQADVPVWIQQIAFTPRALPAPPLEDDDDEDGDA